MRHDGQYKKGKLHRCNLHYNVALVCVKNYRDLRPSNTLLDWESSFEVAAVGRFFKSGKLMATSGYLVSWTGTLDCEFISRSTCKIKKVILLFVAFFHGDSQYSLFFFLLGVI